MIIYNMRSRFITQYTFYLLLAYSLHSISNADTLINPSALNELGDASRKSHSDALIVWQDGKLIGEWNSTNAAEPIEAMSVTKSVVSLAIGKLVTDGKIKSIDQPVWEFYPEWKQGRKKDVTIRHLLSHTSGLQDLPTTGIEIYPSPDFVKLAIAAELTSDPGIQFSYNNKAVNILSGIIQKASGKRMDEYFRAEIFSVMGITNFYWGLDKAGNAQAFAGLQILPKDLLKIGQLVLNRGKWEGHQLIAKNWFDLSTNPAKLFVPFYGLLWWLVPEKVEFVIDDQQISLVKSSLTNSTAENLQFIKKAKRIRGHYKFYKDCQQKMDKAFGPDWMKDPILTNLPRMECGKINAIYADGYLGQYLVIIPEARIIAVRMIEGGKNYNETTDGFDNFITKILALVP